MLWVCCTTSSYQQYSCRHSHGADLAPAIRGYNSPLGGAGAYARVALLLAGRRCGACLENPPKLCCTFAGCLQRQPASRVQPRVRPRHASNHTAAGACSGAAAGAAASSVSGAQLSQHRHALYPGHTFLMFPSLNTWPVCEQKRMTGTIYNKHAIATILQQHCCAWCSTLTSASSLVPVTALAQVTTMPCLIWTALRHNPPLDRCAEPDPRGGTCNGSRRAATPLRLYRGVHRGCQLQSTQWAVCFCP